MRRARTSSLIRVLSENGFGKTPFLRTLAGLHMPLAGQVVWHNDGRAAAADASILGRLCYAGKPPERQSLSTSKCFITVSGSIRRWAIEHR